MPVLAVLEMCFQAFFIIHAIRLGSDRYWIYIILFFPVIGSLVYFFAEYLPSLQRDYRMQKFTNNVSQVLNPGKQVRLLQAEVERTPSLKNKKALADAYVNSGMFDAAIALYHQSLDGLYADDPH
ncbi:MAG: hypothetical protein M0036_07970 [Desulfobacteraceae bacterium]|nr:hypothetical protein [Desulfobacteraceae bacterium]